MVKRYTGSYPEPDNFAIEPSIYRKCLMISDLQSGAEEIEYVLRSDYDALAARLALTEYERDLSRKSLTQAEAQLAEVEALLREARRKLQDMDNMNSDQFVDDGIGIDGHELIEGINAALAARLAEAVLHVPAHAALRIQHLEARLAEAEAERDDQTKWAAHYAARASRLEDALMHLHQAYANKHSPQHRAAALNSAWGVLHSKSDSASVQPVKYGCHCDIENMPDGYEPDACVMDDGLDDMCVYAGRLRRDGKDKTSCAYWKPIMATASQPEAVK